jgi:ATP-binding cassette subfamily B (MDR/TAP) protein 1
MSFSYSSQADSPILRSSNFFFPAGESTFVIGKSGSGKSTLGQLLTRFYLPVSGEILIDGAPIQELSVKWIRNNITLIEQRSVLFDESVFTNIAFGRRDYDQVRKKDVQKSIDLAMLQSVIDTLPDGIDTCVGSGGNLLSGGQKQRVAIGRSQLRDTPILIMDEPTSALDGTNRAAVMKAIREWRKGKTTIVITHDMSQIQARDFVYVLEQGAVVDSGYREELENNPENEKYFRFGDKAPSDEDPFNDDCTATGKASVPEAYLDTCSVSSAESLVDMESGQPCFEIIEPKRKDSQHSRNASRLSSRHSYIERDPFVRFSGIPLHDMNSIRTEDTGVMALPFQDRRTSTAQSPPSTAVPCRRDSTEKSRIWRRKRDRKAKPKAPSLRQILWTIVPNISAEEQLLLALGFLCSLAHACSIPVFSYCLAQVFGSYYAQDNNANAAMMWSLAVLGVAIADGIVSFFMHYSLEVSGQAWVDCLRKKGFRRVLDQPRVWFEKESNRPYKLTACFDQNGEDMKNLVGRFAGFVLVAVAIVIMAVVWSLVVCWKLTLVVLACGPVIYANTRGFERTSGVWEKRCSDASRIISGIFVETFSEIRTVRTLTLESFFHQKHMKAASKCTTVGFKKAGYTGALFGLVESTVIFVSGKKRVLLE